MLRNPVRIEIALSKPVETISQNAYICNEPQKNKILQALFAQETPQRTLIFAASKIKVKQLFHDLLRLGIPAAQMHSDLEQAERDRVMRDFRSGQCPLLVATDIVSRGIDIDDIETVINYNVPRDVEDYVHRIGRTARAGKQGRAITLVAPDERRYFDKIERFLHQRITRLPLPEGLEPSAETRHKNNRQRHPRSEQNHPQQNGKPVRRPHHRRPRKENKRQDKTT